jgi:hypothetical protein
VSGAFSSVVVYEVSFLLLVGVSGIDRLQLTGEFESFASAGIPRLPSLSTAQDHAVLHLGGFFKSYGGTISTTISCA